MSDPLDWNAKTIAEFRANEGKVGGPFEGAPMVLLHHLGRTSGREYVTPAMYLPHDTEPDIMYVFASKGGASFFGLTVAGATSCTALFEIELRPWRGPGAPPSEIESDEKFALRPRVACMVATWKAPGASCCTL